VQSVRLFPAQFPGWSDLVVGAVAQRRPRRADDLLRPVGARSTAREYRGEEGAQQEIEHSIDVEIRRDLAWPDASLDRSSQ
jgi:hypothetical protein